MQNVCILFWPQRCLLQDSKHTCKAILYVQSEAQYPQSMHCGLMSNLLIAWQDYNGLGNTMIGPWYDYWGILIFGILAKLWWILVRLNWDLERNMKFILETYDGTLLRLCWDLGMIRLWWDPGKILIDHPSWLQDYQMNFS